MPCDLFCDASNSMLTATGLPPSVLALQTTRQHPLNLAAPHLGQPVTPFDHFNLALHVGDDRAAVLANRIALLRSLLHKQQPYAVQQLVWLNQTHSTRVHRAGHALSLEPVEADAVLTDCVGVAAIVMTADCLPIVLSDANGAEVAAIHAGWRGLLHGVIEASVAAMQHKPTHAWLGAAIGAGCFEVGAEVKAAFVQHDPQAASAFVPHGERFLADIYGLARQRLAALGIVAVQGGEHCTVLQSAQFYSYRREAKTGRMATLAVRLPTDGGERRRE